jgi:hypothetical protein
MERSGFARASRRTIHRFVTAATIPCRHEGTMASDLQGLSQVRVIAFEPNYRLLASPPIRMGYLMSDQHLKECSS